MMLMKTVLVGASCLVPMAHAFGSAWWANETSDTYVNWPQEVVAILEEEKTTYQAADFPGLPLIRVFQAFPEFEPRVWPLVRGMTRRLNPLLWPRVHYYMEDGLSFGCRDAGADDDAADTVPIASTHCTRHCIHQGRYCVPQKFEIDIKGPQGHDALKEITRRLCLDTIYHAKDRRVSDYLAEFDNENCWSQHPHVRNCSVAVMARVGGNFADIEDCVQEKDAANDVPHPILDRNLKHIKEPHNFTLSDMPVITINSVPVPDGVDGMIDSTTIFHSFCQAFPEHYERPFACDVCEGCQDTRTCMWTLACDGAPFDMAIYYDDGKADVSGGSDTATDAPDEVDQTSEIDQTNSEAFASANENVEASSGGGGGWVFFVVVLVLAAVGCPLAWWVYRERRTKHLLEAIKAGKYGYKDNSNMELGGRQKDLEEEGTEPYVDIAVGNDGPDVVVEDMMDDESEWSENKRASARGVLPEIS